MWILLHNNDDQGARAATRAGNAGLNFVEVELPVGPTAVYPAMIEAVGGIEDGEFEGIIYSGHGATNGQRFKASNGNNLNTQSFATLLGLAMPPRIIFFSCFGGSVVENNLQIFQGINDIEVPVNQINHPANLIGCQVEGPVNSIMGASIQPDMERLVADAAYQPYQATGYSVTFEANPQN